YVAVMRGTLMGIAVLLAMLPATASAAPRPDLAVPVLGSPPANVSVGVPFTVRFTVANRGAGRAGASKIGFFLAAAATHAKRDVRLGTANVKALRKRKQAGGKIALTIPAATAPGTYFLIACADVAARVRESNERNDCRAAGGRIVIAAPSGTPTPT